jgi:hypothetical protein
MKNQKIKSIKKIKIVKDKEGVVFQVVVDPSITKKKRNNPFSRFIKEIIEHKLLHHNVYPENETIGFTGDIKTMSYFFGTLLERYINENQYISIK